MPPEISTGDRLRKSWQATLHRRAVANKGRKPKPGTFSSLGIQFCQSAFDCGKLIFQQSDRWAGSTQLFDLRLRSAASLRRSSCNWSSALRSPRLT